MNKIILIIAILTTFNSIELTNSDTIDYVPNEETAIKIAEAIWLPIYGKSIYEKKPFKAILINNEIWKVQGTYNFEKLGGVPYIEIRKKDCKIIKVTHGK